MSLWDGTGRWIWTRDEGFSEFLQKQAGSITSAAASLLDSVGRVPEHTYWKDGDEVHVKVVNKFTGDAGAIDVIDVTEKELEGEIDFPAMGTKGKGAKRGKLEGNAVNTYWVGEQIFSDGTSEKVEFNIYRELKGGEYHLTFHNVTKDLRGTRVFKRYPYYTFVNETGDTVSLSTYNSGDFLRMIAAMTVNIERGTQHIHAPGGDVLEEQATFSLPDGRAYSLASIKAFETYTLQADLFE